jgi:hypothetical protein
MLLHAASASAAPDACTSLTPVPTKIEVNVKAPDEPVIRVASAEEIQRLARSLAAAKLMRRSRVA